MTALAPFTGWPAPVDDSTCDRQTFREDHHTVEVARDDRVARGNAGGSRTPQPGKIPRAPCPTANGPGHPS